LDVADEIFTLDHTYHDPSSPQVGQGPNEMKKLMSIYRRHSPTRGGPLTKCSSMVPIQW
jgi:hypothetical protein